MYEEKTPEEQKKHRSKIVRRVAGGVFAGLLGINGLVWGPRSCTTVPAGHVKVTSLFGDVRDKELEPGIHFPINPLLSKTTMDARTQEIEESMSVPTKEGLMAGLDVSILYHIDPSKANELYKTVGTSYPDVVIVPSLRNVTRDVVAGFSSEDLYSENRGAISSDITDRLTSAYSERGIVLEKVLLRDVKLPPEVTAAIDRKIGAKQAAEQMQYTLQKETQEAERKRIEAQGIADAQTIIAEGLTPEYLTWRYITTLESLAGSENTTFVMTPYDQQLIPLLPLGESRTTINYKPITPKTLIPETTSDKE